MRRDATRPTAQEPPAPSSGSQTAGALVRAAVVVAVVVLGSFGVTTGTASAMQRDPCADLVHRAEQHLDIAHGFNAMGNYYMTLGYYDLAIHQFDQGSWFIAAAEAYLDDFAYIGC